MSTSRAARLAPVIDMAERAEREAAQALGRCQQQLSQAQGKLGELERYRGDYQQQWINQGQLGVSGQWLMNYQRFLTQLETAVGQQRQAIAGSKTTLIRPAKSGNSAMRVWRVCVSWCSVICTKRARLRISASRKCSMSSPSV